MVMRIGELARRSSVTTKTVRYYESIGLMPEVDRTPSGYRDYGPESLDRLRFIRDAQQTGLSLTEIQSILELKDRGERTCEHTRDLLHRQIEEIDARIRQLHEARAILLELAERADEADPAACTDPHRCQVIEAAHPAGR